MFFSLIIGTLNRATNLEQCIKSLLNQSFKSFEIIIIDQSDDLKTKQLVELLNDEKIKYRYVNYRGLSKARNEGMNISNGDYICLIDDDAFYYPDYLLGIIDIINDKGHVICSNQVENMGKLSEIQEKTEHEKKYTYRKIIRNCPSPILAFPRKIIDEIGGFDENFGVGAKFGAGEETDLLLRAYRKGYRVFFNKKSKAIHPYGVQQCDEVNSCKLDSYAYGIGAMYSKNFSICILIPFLEQVVKYICKCIMLKPNSKSQFTYFINGFKAYKKRIHN